MQYIVSSFIQIASRCELYRKIHHFFSVGFLLARLFLFNARHNSFICSFQSALRHTIFPVGGLSKKEVKRIAGEIGLGRIAAKEESMGICFIGSRRFKSFINDYIVPTPGW